MRSICESILGPIEWRNDEQGVCRCPGDDLHTGKTGARDCSIMLSGDAPTVFCFHSSCKNACKAASDRIRRALKMGGKSKLEPREVRKIDPMAKLRHDLETLSVHALDGIIAKHAWNAADAWESSPIRLEDPKKDADLFLNLFKSDDIIWIGDVMHSGEKYAHCFDTRATLQALGFSGNFITPCVYKVNTTSRKNDNVLRKPYLVIESDELNHSEMLALLNWISTFLPLRAIIDTGGKSLHGWFDSPDAELEKTLKGVLSNMKCDPATFKLSQPVRIPGVMRDNGKMQQLLYLNYEQRAVSKQSSQASLSPDRSFRNQGV